MSSTATSLLDNWQAQLEELLALHSIFGDEAFRVLVAASQHRLAGGCSAHTTSTADGPTHEESETAASGQGVDLEALLTSPPPDSVTVLAAQQQQSDDSSVCAASSTPQHARAPHTSAAFFLCEALVHVDMPASGVQLVRPPSQQQHHHHHHHQQQQQQQQQESGSSQHSPSPRPSHPPHPPPTLHSPPPSLSLHPMSPPLHHLPPVHIQLTLPATYPSHTAPRAHVSALWLGPADAQQLAQQLCRFWHPGSPVLFEWLDWLQVSALSHLGVHNSSPSHPAPLLLHPPRLATNPRTPTSITHQTHTRGPRTSASQPEPHPKRPEGHQGGGGSASGSMEREDGGGAWDSRQLEWLLADMSSSIQRYAASRARALFGTSTCLCQICYDETLGAKCVLLECGHAFCVPCMSTFFRTQLKSGQVEGMRCPDPTCREPVAPYHVQALLTPDEFAHWERLLLQRTLDKMDDVVYCPRCESICLEDKDHCAECPSCMFAFCGLCLGSWHPGVRCMGDEERLLSMARRHPESDIKNQLKSLELIKGTTKKCPGCGADIERSEGCNKMRCTYCDTAFCYRCGKEVTSYDHFSANTCPIFDRSEVDRLNAMFGGDLGGGYAPRGQQGLVRIQFAPCVVCGQVNLRENGNNLIRCGACSQYFCNLCRTWLRSKPGHHFGPSRCKQHT